MWIPVYLAFKIQPGVLLTRNASSVCFVFECCVWGNIFHWRVFQPLLHRHALKFCAYCTHSNNYQLMYYKIFIDFWLLFGICCNRPNCVPNSNVHINSWEIKCQFNQFLEVVNSQMHHLLISLGFAVSVVMLVDGNIEAQIRLMRFL